MDVPRRRRYAMAAARWPPPRRHQLCCVVAAICNPYCHHRVVATLPATYTFLAATGCTLSMPAAMFDHLEKFCSNVLKFHSNFHRIPVRIF